MLDYLFFASIIAMIAISVLGIFRFENKIPRIICIIVIVVWSVCLFIGGPIIMNATKEAEVSNIEISEIYKNQHNEYFVKLEKNDETLKVKVENIYKGDGNYLIRYHNPKMTKFHEFLFKTNKTEFDLVVTDLDIPVLSSMD